MHDINNIDLNLLKSLHALIAEKHVGRAAERMNITQPAMSHTLARLRRQFDDPLFVRTAKGLVPTARTEGLAESVDRILSGIEALFAPESFEPANIKETIRIETHDFVATSFLSSPMRKIQLEAPDITFDLRAINRQSFDRLDSHETDLIIGAGLQANPKFLQRTLINEQLVCLLDTVHPALTDWSPKTLFRYPHARLGLLASGEDPVDRYAKAHKMLPRKTGLITESLHLQSAFLKGTEMIAFLPKALAENAARINDLKWIACPFSLPPVAIKAFWHERDQKSPLHQWITSRIGEQ